MLTPRSIYTSRPVCLRRPLAVTSAAVIPGVEPGGVDPRGGDFGRELGWSRGGVDPRGGDSGGWSRGWVDPRGGDSRGRGRG